MNRYNYTSYLNEMSIFMKMEVLKKMFCKKFVMATITILLCSISASLMAQSHTKADHLFDNGLYSEALELYYEALDEQPQDSVYIKYRIGESLLNMNRPEEALNWLTVAKSQGYYNPDILYSLGTTYMLMGKYSDALTQFQSYEAVRPDDELVAAKIASCKFAQNNTEVNSTFVLKPIDALNTTGSEYGVSYYKNDLIYSSTGAKQALSKRKTSPRTGLGYSSLYIAKTDSSGLFLQGTKLVDVLEEKGNRGVVSYDPQTGMLYCTSCRSGQKNCYISIVKMQGKHFKEVGRLEIGNAEYGIGHPFVTPDGKRLYFTSNMQGSYGGDDIWYADKQPDGTWGKPINAGPEINTLGNEVFPYVHNERLFFASDGYEQGYGGLDLYVSKITNEGFSKPFNLQHPFNTEHDDFNLVISPNKTGGILVSNRNNQQSSDDMYWFDGYPCVIVAEGTVYDKQTKKPISGANVILYNSEGKQVGQFVTDSAAHYQTFLQQGINYRINASANGYSVDNKKINGEKFDCFITVNAASGYDTDFYLDRLALRTHLSGDTILVRDIYYEFDLSRITKQSQEELDVIVGLLKKYPQINILIESHTDLRGSEEYNKYLSEARAYSAAYYLQQEGIDSYRIQAKGYGKTKPVIIKPANEEEQQMNRRTTFTLLSSNNIKDEVVKSMSTEKMLQQETPAEITEHNRWWVEVDVVKHADLSTIYEIEKKIDMDVEAIKYDDESTGICVGPYNTLKQATDVATSLKDKGVKAVIKTIEPTSKKSQLSAMLF